MALQISARGYVNGDRQGLSARPPAPELLADKDIREFYLGIGEEGRRSFRDIKTYRRSPAVEPDVSGHREPA